MRLKNNVFFSFETNADLYIIIITSGTTDTGSIIIYNNNYYMTAKCATNEKVQNKRT